MLSKVVLSDVAEHSQMGNPRYLGNSGFTSFAKRLKRPKL
jgi:hypothetical protein